MDLQSSPLPRSCSLVENQEASSSAAAAPRRWFPLHRPDASTASPGEVRKMDSDPSRMTAQLHPPDRLGAPLCSSKLGTAEHLSQFSVFNPLFRETRLVLLEWSALKSSMELLRVQMPESPDTEKNVVVLTNLLYYCPLSHLVFCIIISRVVVKPWFPFVITHW